MAPRHQRVFIVIVGLFVTSQNLLCHPMNTFTDDVNYYTQETDHICDDGQIGDISDKDIQRENDSWRNDVINSRIVQISEGCGNMHNRLLRFSNGLHVCARYRTNTQQIQSEIYASYFARILGLGGNIPRAILMRFIVDDDRWKNVRYDVMHAGWINNTFIVLTEYVYDLKPIFLPVNIPHENMFVDKTDPRNLDTMLQWSDMITFDFLIANTDRLVSFFINRNWNTNLRMLQVQNLYYKVCKVSKYFVFLDNESGFEVGYNLLQIYEQHYTNMMNSMCLFRKQTLDRIEMMIKHNNLHELFEKAITKEHGDLRNFTRLSKKAIAILRSRLKFVYDFVLKNKCEVI